MSLAPSNHNWNRLLAHTDRLHAWARKRLSPRLQQYHPPQDLVNEVLQYAYENQAAWEDIPDDQLLFYLFRVAKYFAMNHNRKSRFRGTLSPAAGIKESRVLGTRHRHDDTASQKIHRGEKRRAAERILERLANEDYRIILEAVWIDGLTLQQASERIGRSLAATKSLLHRAMEACRGIAQRQSFAGFRISGDTA